MQVTPEQRKSWRENTAQSPFNQWLDGQVRRADGSLDLARLHQIARSHGIEREQQYAHLNPGQQRMNIGNLLRRVVDVAEYDGPALRSGSAAGANVSRPATQNPAAPDAPALPESKPLAAPTPAPRPEFLTHASVRDLLKIHAQVIEELRDRQIVRTGNAPLGDYAELLFSVAFGWTLSNNSSMGFDAVDERGVRYQIKARRLTGASKSRQLSAIRKLPEKTFDMLAAVVFDADHQVSRAILLPHAEVAARAARVEHTNSWRLTMDDKLWRAPGAIDVTKPLSLAETQL